MPMQFVSFVKDVISLSMPAAKLFKEKVPPNFKLWWMNIVLIKNFR